MKIEGQLRLLFCSTYISCLSVICRCGRNACIDYTILYWQSFIKPIPRDFQVRKDKPATIYDRTDLFPDVSNWHSYFDFIKGANFSKLIEMFLGIKGASCEQCYMRMIVWCKVHNKMRSIDFKMLNIRLLFRHFDSGDRSHLEVI